MTEVVIRTERLILRKGTLDDAPFMLALLNQPSFLENIGDKGVKDLEGAREHIRRAFFDAYAQNGFGPYIMTLPDARPVGICGLFKRAELSSPDIGYAVLDDYAGQGYTSEAAFAVRDYARREFAVDSLVAITSPNNTASRRVLHKLGLEHRGQVNVGGHMADYFS